MRAARARVFEKSSAPDGTRERGLARGLVSIQRRMHTSSVLSSTHPSSLLQLDGVAMPNAPHDRGSFHPLSSTYLKLEAEEPSAEKRAEALQALSEVLHDCSLAASQELGHALRIEGGIQRLGQLLLDTSDDVSTFALWILGNLCCKEVDPNSDETKAELLSCGCEDAVLHCLASERVETLSTACGLSLNLSSNARWCRVLSRHAVRFEDLLSHSDQTISRFATATLRNLIVVGETDGSAERAGEGAGALGSASGSSQHDADQGRAATSPHSISPKAMSAVEMFEEERKVAAMNKVHATRVITNAVKQRRRFREMTLAVAAMKRLQELGGTRNLKLTGKYSPELLGLLWREASLFRLAKEEDGSSANGTP